MAGQFVALAAVVQAVRAASTLARRKPAQKQVLPTVI
jgi:hypothetical protein